MTLSEPKQFALAAHVAAGLNSYGQLGDGTTNNQFEPVQVATNLVFVDITAGAYHSCGLLANASYACWGEGPLTGAVGGWVCC